MGSATENGRDPLVVRLERLNETIEENNRVTSKLNTRLYWYTVFIAVCTAAITIMTAVMVVQNFRQ